MSNWMESVAEWREYRIGDIAQIFDGPHATPKKIPEGPWFLSISSLDHGRLNLTESAHISEEDFAKWTRRVVPRPGDLLFSYETRLGEAALMPSDIRACLGRRMGLLRPDRTVVNPQFLLYAYLSPSFQETITTRQVHGATVDRIPLVDLPSWPISLPSLTEQNAICDLLGALDAKITINNRITAIADDLIHQLYVFAQSKCEVATVPLLDAIEITFGSPFSSSQFTNVGAGRPLLRIRDLKTHRPQIWTKQELHNELVVKAGDVVAGMDAEFRPTFWLGRDAVLNQRVLHARSRVGGGFSLAREALRTPLATVENYKTGTTVAHLNKSDLVSQMIDIPCRDAITAFEAAAEPLRLLIVSATRESDLLAELRDTILPQLMSSRLRIRDAEKIVEDEDGYSP